MVGGEMVAGRLMMVPLSFPIPLATAPIAHVVPPGESTAACPGTAADPQAASGNFCLYVTTNKDVAALEPCDTVIGICSAMGRFGGGLQLQAAVSGLVFSQGTWAVTG